MNLVYKIQHYLLSIFLLALWFISKKKMSISVSVVFECLEGFNKLSVVYSCQQINSNNTVK